MTFKEGLLKARGQITFIVALALSTGVIIYLETLDTEARIQQRVTAELARRGGTGAMPSPALDSSVRQTLRQAEEAYAADPAAAANRAAILMSLSTAVQLGILTPDEGKSRVRVVMDRMAQQRGETSVALASALQAVAVTFPDLQAQTTALENGS